MVAPIQAARIRMTPRQLASLLEEMAALHMTNTQYSINITKKICQLMDKKLINADYDLMVNM